MDHSKISPTAKITAYWRSLSDIAYSKEIAEAVGAEQTAREMLGDRIVTMGSISPSLFEARYKSINYGLRKTGISNAMELACGLSPRGLEIVSGGGIYVGTDLPEMCAESSPIIAAIAERAGIKMDNLHLQPANVLNKEEMEDGARHFNGAAFAICNEGLLPYLNKEEKAKMAENIRSLLLHRHGTWITTDVVFKALRTSISTFFGTDAKRIIQSAMRNISSQTGSNIAANDFVDKADAMKFYENLGFVIEEIPMYTGDYQFSTASRIRNEIREDFINILSSSKVWIMTPRH